MNIERYEIRDPTTGLMIAVSRAEPNHRRSKVPIVYMHGGTFPSELAVGYRFDGVSWRDCMLDTGREVWAFDFLGFGASGRFPAMSASPIGIAPLGRTPEASAQLAAVVSQVLQTTGQPRVALIAHSWGTMAAGKFAGEHPQEVERIVFFAPIVERRPAGEAASPGTSSAALGAAAQLPAWMPMTLAAQFKRFTEDVPHDHAPVLSQAHFDVWGAGYLATDPIGGRETPPSVHVPLGPVADIRTAWHGHLSYDPSLIKAPLRIVRGEWDSLSNDADAAWLIGKLGSSTKDDAKLAAGTHLMHLEEGRTRVYAATESWLSA